MIVVLRWRSSQCKLKELVPQVKPYSKSYLLNVFGSDSSVTPSGKRNTDLSKTSLVPQLVSESTPFPKKVAVVARSETVAG